MLGCDFAGKIERLGKDVTKVAEGDTIAGLIWGGKWKQRSITRSGYLYAMHRRDQGPRGIQRVHQGPREHLLQGSKEYLTYRGCHYPTGIFDCLARLFLKGQSEHRS